MNDVRRFDFEEMFDQDYLYFYGPLLDQSSDADCELIWRLLELEAATPVLDLACGHGRIANRLAARGAHVTGLDRTALFLARARAEADERGLEVEYVEGDMRSLPFDDQLFDCTVSWFTSFGYFDDDENRQVLREAHRTLKPGGRLLLELNNLADLLPRWQAAVVVERDGDLMVDRPRFDPLSGRAVTERVAVRDGRVRRFTFSVRMFIPAELRDWLLEAGFADVAFYDNHGGALTGHSRRAIAVAHR